MPGDIETEVRRYFDTHAPEIAAAYLCGRTARGMSGPSSDVDIAVLPRIATRGTLASLHLDVSRTN